jgi:hypothetical protein
VSQLAPALAVYPSPTHRRDSPPKPRSDAWGPRGQSTSEGSNQLKADPGMLRQSQGQGYQKRRGGHTELSRPSLRPRASLFVGNVQEWLDPANHSTPGSSVFQSPEMQPSQENRLDGQDPDGQQRQQQYARGQQYGLHPHPEAMQVHAETPPGMQLQMRMQLQMQQPQMHLVKTEGSPTMEGGREGGEWP